MKTVKNLLISSAILSMISFTASASSIELIKADKFNQKDILVQAQTYIAQSIKTEEFAIDLSTEKQLLIAKKSLKNNEVIYETETISAE